MTAETDRVFRVTVRGQFDDVSAPTRALLLASLADHDILRSAYTPEGTFTYDRALAFFNLRYELRASGPDARELVELEALDDAERFLAARGIGAKRLRADVVDMSAMTDVLRRRR
jgi:hypothetical protein